MGVLAGGVAHDFNNLLMTVLGNTELLQVELSEESPLQRQLSNIQVAANGAAELARQMRARVGWRVIPAVVPASAFLFQRRLRRLRLEKPVRRL